MRDSTDKDSEAYVAGRIPGTTYFSRQWSYKGTYDKDEKLTDRVGQVARYAYTVIDSDSGVLFESTNGREVVIRETEKTKQQLKAIFFEQDRHIGRLLLQRFNADGSPLNGTNSGSVFALTGEEIGIAADFFRMVESSAISDEYGFKLNPGAIDSIVAVPEARAALYENSRDEIFNLIEDDVHARDVIALARRRQQLEVFEQLMNDDGYFHSKKEEWQKTKDEDVWQYFFELNPWVFSFGLSSQVLLSWNKDKLESVVSGATIANSGKRVDALMRTAGFFSSLCFVEIKTPKTVLLSKQSYRSASWRPTGELTGAVAQCHATLDLARSALGEKLRERDADGFETHLVAHYCRPRSYLIAGQTSEFLSDEHNINHDMYRSFENFRRSLTDPEIITYDELYERALRVVNHETAGTE